MTVTGIVVQARAGSSRLPGKVLMPLAGRTVLAHVIERCLATEEVDVVCCAVPEGDANDAAGVCPCADGPEVAADRDLHLEAPGGGEKGRRAVGAGGREQEQPLHRP